MNSPRLLFLLPWVAVFLLSSPACIQVPDIEPAKAEVRITSPDGLAYTNGVLEVRVAVTGHAPERVELLLDGEVLAEVAAPYTYAWDTAAVAEGTHQLVARAVFGEVVFASEAREVVVDRTPPQVVSRTPEPGAQDVWVKSPIQAVFSEPVKASTLNEASVRLTVGGVEVARTVSLSGDGRTVTVEPTTPVTTPNTLALTLSAAVMDLAGNKVSLLSNNWNWAAPEFVPYPPIPKAHPDMQSLEPPLVRLNKSGQPIVALRAFNGRSMNVFIFRWTGHTWEKLGSGLKINPNPDFSADSPSIQIAPDGEPIVAWHEGVDLEFDNSIHVARWTGEQWKLFGDNRGILPSRPHSLSISLQLTSDGLPLVAFNMDPEDGEVGAIYVYKWSGSTWNPIGPPLHGDAKSGTRTPALALDSNDNPTIAFTLNATPTIYARHWTGSAWEDMGASVVTSSNHSINSVHLAIDNRNRPLVTWSRSEHSTGKPSIAFSTWNTSEWTPLQVPASTIPQSRSYSPTICRGESGQLLLSWTESSETQTSASIHRWTASTWAPLTAPFSASSDNSTHFSSSSMDCDTSGVLVLAGTEVQNSRPGVQEIVVYRLNR